MFLINNAVVTKPVHVLDNLIEMKGNKLTFAAESEDAIDVWRVFGIGGRHESDELIVSEDDEMRLLVNKPDILDAGKRRNWNGRMLNIHRLCSR